MPGAGDGRRFSLALLAVVGLALALRLSGLTQRPLHYDEGVNGWFSLRLYWWSQYAYQPDNYHGPFLYYANLAFFHLLGPDVTSLRLATALSGALVPLALLPARRLAGDASLLVAGLLLAVGPGLVYFSRTAIHEIHLVFFTALWAAALARFAVSPRLGWALLGAAAAALCFANKETAILTAGSLAAGAGLAWLAGVRSPDGAPDRDLFGSDGRGSDGRGGRDRREALRLWTLGSPRAWLWGALLFSALTVAFYSSFFSHWMGVADFFRGYAPWTEYAVTGRNQGKPFGYFGGVTAATEGPVRWVAVAAAAFALARRQRLGLALSAWAGSALLVYSAIPYKTPWCVLQIDLPVFLLAGWGAGQAWQRVRAAGRPAIRAGAAVAFAGCLAPVPLLLARSLEDNRERVDEFRRPYVYHQTYAEFHDLVRDVLGVAEADPEADGGGPRVVNAGVEFPLSFYTLTRGWKPGRSEYPEETPSREQLARAELVLANSDFLDGVADALADDPGWHRQRYFYRPGQYATVFYRRHLWDRYQAAGGREAVVWPRPALRPLPPP